MFAGQETEEGRRSGGPAVVGEALPHPRPAKERPLAALRHLIEAADEFCEAGHGVHWGWCRCGSYPTLLLWFLATLPVANILS